jgi:K+-sensing histidine kinase KdpD
VICVWITSRLDSAQKARVFDRFFSRDSSAGARSTSDWAFHCTELVALQKGTLELLDTPGGGCTFRITLN